MRQAVEFVSWSILCLEAYVALCSAKYLPWRVRLYVCAAQCAEQQGDLQTALVGLAVKLELNAFCVVESDSARTGQGG